MTDERAWRVPRGITGLKIAGTAVFGLLALVFAGDPPRFAVAVVAAVVAGAFALRDLLAPVRISAGADGVTVVTGFAGRRHLTWHEIERIRVDDRRRLGLRSEYLEIDSGDTLHLFSPYELDERPAEVAEALQMLRTGAS